MDHDGTSSHDLGSRCIGRVGRFLLSQRVPLASKQVSLGGGTTVASDFISMGIRQHVAFLASIGCGLWLVTDVFPRPMDVRQKLEAKERV